MNPGMWDSAQNRAIDVVNLERVTALSLRVAERYAETPEFPAECHMNAFDIAVTGAFYALDTKGKRYEILHYNAMAGDVYKGRRYVPGSAFYELLDGCRVEEVGNGQFTVYLGSGPVRLTREPIR